MLNQAYGILARRKFQAAIGTTSEFNIANPVRSHIPKFGEYGWIVRGRLGRLLRNEWTLSSSMSCEASAYVRRWLANGDEGEFSLFEPSKSDTDTLGVTPDE
jgi:hypothetical protein